VGILEHDDLQRDHATAFLDQKIRTSVMATIHHFHFVNIGMWFERFVIIPFRLRGIIFHQLTMYRHIY